MGDYFMIVEMRTYTIHPGTAPAYFKVYQTMGMEAQKEILGHMVGYYATEIGDLNQVVHMWAYDTLDSRTERRAKLMQDERWKKMLPELRKFIISQKTQILIPAPFAKIPKIN